MNIKIWDKKSDINNISLEKLSSYRYDLKSAIETGEEVFLVFNGTPRVEEILFEYTLRSNYSLGMELSCEQVAQKYLNILEQEKQDKVDIYHVQQEEIEQLKKESASTNYILMQNDLL